MDDRQFDAFSRTLANRTSRRTALKAGGATAALAGFFGLNRSRQTLAQDDDLGGGPEPASVSGLQPDGRCHLFFEANVRVGPSTELGERSQIAGTLDLLVGDNGGIDDSFLTLDDGTVYPVSGQASGRSISLRIGIDGDVLIAVGVGERNARSCVGESGGPTTGPARGDLGDWIAYPIAPAEDEPTPTAVATTEPPPPAAPTPTPTPDCSGVQCPISQMVDPATCDCVCYDNGVACGDICCPVGSVCHDAGSGACSCPAGSFLCGNTCIGCGQNQMLDYDSCTCVDRPCPLGQDLCNGVCVDIVNSTQNCGFCGNVCGTGIPCIAGSCTCPPGYSVCPGTGCKDLRNDASNCGTCGKVCSAGQSCSNGNCV